MRKSIIGIIMAVTLVGSSLAFPVQAYADYSVENWGVVVTNDDGIGNNHGTVENNYGTVETNNGTVENNDGIVETNNGTVNSNGNRVEVNTDRGTVENNNGTVETNNGIVETNYRTVTTNNKTVKINYETVGTNKGTVETNDGTVTTNNEKVETNKGTVETNDGTVENNFKTVENNYGTVVNNFGGTVNGGTVTNQWYEYILTGGKYIDGSGQTTTGDNRTWIGQAQEEKADLGEFYITVAANDGMTFDYARVGDKQVQGITNADGSISFGKISSAIRICFKQLININNNDEEDNANNTTASSVGIDNAGIMATIESIIANEEAMPVTSFISDEAVAKIPEAAKNSGATYNLSVITSSQGFTAAINKISETVKMQNAVNNAGGRITSTTIYSEKPMLFTADVLNAISASDIDFVFVFMHNGKMYKVTIPRGAKIDFTGHACEGSLYFGKILGTTEEIG